MEKVSYKSAYIHYYKGKVENLEFFANSML